MSSNPGRNMSSKLSPADWFAAAAVTCAASLLAWLALWPIGPGNDQALFLYYARAMREGATLYADLWDNKPPGIFAFYVGAAALFGEGWGAVRLAFALWLGVGAGAIAALCRIVAPGRIAWMIAPALTVGLALLRLDAERPAQVESLLPTLLAVLMLLMVLEPVSTAARSLRWIGAGLIVGLVAAFKPVLAPVAVALCLTGLVWRMGRRELSMPFAAMAVGLGIIGTLLVWLPIAVWVERHQIGPEFVWTMLRYPQLALAEVPMQKPAMLVAALRWLIVTCGLLLPAAALYAWQAGAGEDRSDSHSGRDSDRNSDRNCRHDSAPASERRPGLATLVTVMCAAWLVSGLAMILMQRFSWWDTHMDLLVWPIGLMAALGTSLSRDGDTDVSRGRARPAVRLRARQMASLLVIGTMALHGARFLQAASHSPDWPRPAIEREALETAHTVMALSSTPCGTIYAIGDQAGVERETGLRQAIATHGLWFGAFLPSQVRRLPAELEAARPDLVYVDGAERRDFEAAYPAQALAIERWLARDYTPGTVDGLQGQWWQRRRSPQDAVDCPLARRFAIPAGNPATTASSAASASAKAPGDVTSLTSVTASPIRTSRPPDAASAGSARATSPP
jgi:hypothetical protein